MLRAGAGTGLRQQGDKFAGAGCRPTRKHFFESRMGTGLRQQGDKFAGAGCRPTRKHFFRDRMGSALWLPTQAACRPIPLSTLSEHAQAESLAPQQMASAVHNPGHTAPDTPARQPLRPDAEWAEDKQCRLYHNAVQHVPEALPYWHAGWSLCRQWSP